MSPWCLLRAQQGVNPWSYDKSLSPKYNEIVDYYGKLFRHLQVWVTG